MGLEPIHIGLQNYSQYGVGTHSHWASGFGHERHSRLDATALGRPNSEERRHRAQASKEDDVSLANPATAGPFTHQPKALSTHCQRFEVFEKLAFTTRSTRIDM